MKNTKRLMTLALTGTLLAPAARVAAQQGQESVADAARKAQAEKKNAPKAKITIDNDNLGTLTGVVNVVGEEPAPPADQTKKVPGTAPQSAKGQAPVKDEGYWRDKFTAANQKLADDKRELDVTQREYNLKQQQFYTDPMASLKQEYSRQDLNDTKTKIDSLTAAVAQDNADIANLEDELRQAGGNPGWARPSDQPPQAGSPAETAPAAQPIEQPQQPAGPSYSAPAPAASGSGSPAQ